MALWTGGGSAAQAPPGRPQEAPVIHDLDREPERTLRAGEGFRATLFGAQLEYGPRDRRSVSAWDVGVATAPRADHGAVLPFASLYFWQHPHDDFLFRGTVAGVYNELFFAMSPPRWGETELVGTLETFTWPAATGELVDGEVDDAQELVWGYVRPGAGIGWRWQVGPAQDNMLAADLTGEVGMLYFGRGGDTGATFAVPDSTPELRGRAKVRLDLLERNLLELPHEGFAAGGDLVVGHRPHWEDWGDPALVQDAGRTRTYAVLTGYAFAATGLPLLHSDKHRLLGAVHGGIGDGVDRFSAPRVGGGPDPRGEEYELISRPILPGAAIGEFFPRHYLLGYAGYRLQPTFFAFLDAGVTVGWLDRDRALPGGIERRNDVLTAVSARLSSGFYGRTRFQLLYAYNFDVVRDGEAGGYELTFHLTGYF